MYKISTLNKISKKGLNRFTDAYEVGVEAEEAAGILVRSQDMHTMEFSKDLLAIARAGAGVNNIPIDRCSEKGVVVFNTPGANANAVKELVLAGIFMAARNIPEAIIWTNTLKEDAAKAVEKGKAQFAGREIMGKTLGVVGLGAIGVLVANAAEQMGMKVIGYDPYITLHAAHALSNTIPVAQNLDLVLPKCDYVTIHIPALESTKGMFNTARFAQMKNSACLLNFARDSLVVEKDLLDALKNGLIRKYVTDFPTDAVLHHSGIVCIPHLGASSQEAEDNCAMMAVDQMMDYLEHGNITNAVNFPACSLGPMTTMSRVGVLNKNIPAMLGKITGIFADMNINISDLLNRSKGDLAYTLVDVDSDVDETALRNALNVEGIIGVRVMRNK